MAICKVTLEEIDEMRQNCKVEIVDGYHRYCALKLLRECPAKVLRNDVSIDWKELSALYPEWIQMDRSIIYIDLIKIFMCLVYTPYFLICNFNHAGRNELTLGMSYQTTSILKPYVADSLLPP